MLSLHSNFGRVLESMISLKTTEDPGGGFGVGVSWHSQQLSALSLPSNAFLCPHPLPAGSPPAGQSPVYFQQKAGGAQINSKQVGFWFSSKSARFWPARTGETAWQGFGGQQSKTVGMLAGVSPWDPSVVSARAASLHHQGASIQIEAKLGLTPSPPAEPAGDQCVQFWNLKTCNSAMNVHAWTSVQASVELTEMCWVLFFFLRSLTSLRLL